MSLPSLFHCPFAPLSMRLHELSSLYMYVTFCVCPSDVGYSELLFSRVSSVRHWSASHPCPAVSLSSSFALCQINIDFIRWSSVSCVAKADFYTSYLVRPLL